MTTNPIAIAVALIAAFIAGAWWAHDRSTVALTAAKARGDEAERQLDAAKKDMIIQIGSAFQQTSRAIDMTQGTILEARGAIAEARGIMREAVDLTKEASRAILGPTGMGDLAPPPATSIRENDAAAMRARSAKS